MPEKKKAEKEAPEKQSFEQALELLEKNAQRMSAPDLPLEESIQLYAQSVQLISFCQKSLEKAKLKIETLESGEDKVEGAAVSPAQVE